MTDNFELQVMNAKVRDLTTSFLQMQQEIRELRSELNILKEANGIEVY